MSKKVTRLFTQFSPRSYKLHIILSEDKQSFSGSVVISGERKGRPSKRITLHQKSLKITSAKITHTDKKGVTSDIPLARTVLHNSRDEFRLHTTKDLYAGDYSIEISFSGTITRNMEGIYPSFFEEDGEQKQLLATQFESHHAREAFPCIDEPEAKATFDLTLTHRADEIALSNTPIKSEELSNDKQSKTTVFDTTPIMSTYLLAFVVGELSYREARSKNNVLIRTYATKYQVEHSQFALDTAVQCMDFYEDYYDIPFPLAKCDFVALPDFASGAMENWGLITFREQALLCDDANTSLSSKQYVAIVVAHELTHQWFGNLVTMRWWTDLWLNEGFASWMEYLAIDHYFPQWQLWTQFSVDEQQLALKLDSLEHTHPVEVSINHPDEIRTIFDAISYQKGASVIHMLHDYLGADGFRDGLRHYLKKHAYGNTHTVDLWQALEDVTKQPVRSFMHAWTSQAGFPIVEVSDAGNHLKIVQKRFVTNPKSSARQDNTLWPVPLLTDGLAKSTADKKVSNIVVSGEKPIKVNVGQTGFYRASYDNQMIEKQILALKNGALDPIDRMGLLSDSIEVTKAGYQSVTLFLDLLAHYEHEDSLAVWEIIAGSTGSIRSALSKSDADDGLREAMKPFIRDLTKFQLDRLGWDEKQNEDHLDSLLRPILLGLNAGSDNPKTVNHALKLFDNRLTKNGAIHPDIRGVIYSTAARIRGNDVFDTLLDMYKTTKSSDEKLSITAAMTSFEDVKVHKKVLDLIKTDTIRLQDVSYWIAYSFMNRHGRAATWDWLTDNWEWLRKNLGGDLSFSRMPVYAARTFGDKKSLEAYKEFFSAHMEPIIERSYNQGLEIGEATVAWRKRDAEDALLWFTKKTT